MPDNSAPSIEGLPAQPGPQRSRDTLRGILSRLALVSVQGEQLQRLCDELAPVIRVIRQDPQLAEVAELLATALQEASSVAQATTETAEALGAGLQAPGLDQRRAPPSPHDPGDR